MGFYAVAVRFALLRESQDTDVSFTVEARLRLTTTTIIITTTTKTTTTTIIIIIMATYSA